MAVLSLKKVFRFEVLNARGKRVGRVGDMLFGTGRSIVGLTVERAPLLWLFPRKDKYLAFDRAEFGASGVRVTADKDAWGPAAEKRLGLTWDETVIWLGMPVRTRSGRKFGRVRDAAFDPATGELASVSLSEGVATDVTVGTRELPARFVVGFDGSAVVLEDEVADVQTTGGAAAVAGRGVVKAKAAGDRAADQAVEVVGKATEYGVAAVTAAAKSQAGRKAVGFLKSVKRRIDDAIDDDE